MKLIVACLAKHYSLTVSLHCVGFVTLIFFSESLDYLYTQKNVENIKR